MDQKKYKVVTLGCRTNQYESQAYQDQLSQIGYRATLDQERADLCIVNTCSVTESADSRSKYAIRQLKKQKPQSRVFRCLYRRGVSPAVPSHSG